MAESSPRIIGFCCQNAIRGEGDMAGNGRVSFEPTIKIVILPCSSKVEILAIIKAFEAGADGVFILACPKGKCHLLGGNDRAQRIVNHTKGLLDEIGIERSRLEMFQLETPEWQHFEQVAQTMIDRIESLIYTHHRDTDMYLK